MGKKIKLDVSKKSFAVLTDIENKIIAIITCKKNENIDNKIILAIKEDLIVEKVEIEANNNVFNRERPFNFTAHVTDEEGETNRCDYELTFAAIY